MPIYAYECEAGHEFDFAQKFKDEPLTRCQCATCDARAKRVLAPSSFVLKGKGWAKDGYSQCAD